MTRFRVGLLIWALLTCGVGMLATAQVPMTGAGKGAPTAAGASVTADQVTGGAGVYQATSNNFNSTPITITGALTNPGLLCALARADNVNDVTTGLALTWNGVSMPFSFKQVDSVTGQARVAAIFGLRNPASGSHTLNVSATNVAADNFVGCASFFNVNPASDGAAFPNTQGSQNASTVSVTSASGHIVFGSINDGTLSGMLGSTVFSNVVSGSIINAGADYVVSSGVSTTVGSGAVSVAIAGVDIAP